MKVQLLFLFALIPLIFPNVLGMCAPEYLEPGEPCMDVFGTLIIEPHEAQIVNLDGQLFRLIGPFALERESDDRISLDGVLFTHPSYPNPLISDGPVSVKIIFDDGMTESISKVGAHLPFIEFTIHQDPQVGVRQNADGTFDFLLSVENQFISPLKQFKLGIAIDEIRCKEGLQLAIKNSNDNPVCIKETSIEKLSTRNYISDLIIIGFKHQLPEIEN